MLIDEKRKAIFIHIPKTAGQTVHNAHVKYCKAYREYMTQKRHYKHNPLDPAKPFPQAHLSYDEISEVIGFDPLSEGWTVYSIVRNPWDRYVSFYHYGLNKLGSDVFKDFDQFIRFATGNLDEEKDADLDVEKVTGGWLNSVFSQDHFVKGAIGDPACTVLRFESVAKLGKVYVPTKTVHKLKLWLGHLNKSSHDQYSKYYTSKTKKMVAEYEAWVIDQFQYKFERQ